MKIKEVEFVTSAVKPDQYPSNALPEFALAGRSNVGKSSLINTMIGRKNLARTSGTPGKTQTINFYLINQSIFFADVPGYGFARVSKAQRRGWGQMMETYFQQRTNLQSVIQVVDLRHPPSADDKTMFQFLRASQIPMIVVATKADKIAKGKQEKHLHIIRTELGLGPEDSLVLFSAVTKQGKSQLWSILKRHIDESHQSHDGGID